MNHAVKRHRGIPEDWPHRRASHFVRCGGVHWHVQIMGSGPVMLLLHGTGSSTHSFRELMTSLSMHFTVIAPDLPGHAFSEVSDAFDLTLPSIATALSALLDELEVEPTIGVGHSAGAALLIRMTLDKSIVPSLLVGIGAALVPFRGIARALYPSSARLLSLASRVMPLRVRSTESVERVLASTGSSLEGGGIELYRRLSEQHNHVAAVLSMMSTWDLEPLQTQLPRLRTPLLLLAGENDRAVPVSQQHAVHRRIPNSRLVVLENTGHLLHEERPHTVHRLILDEVARTHRMSNVRDDDECKFGVTTAMRRSERTL
jgi:magnesium chelatase accessory protein